MSYITKQEKDKAIRIVYAYYRQKRFLSNEMQKKMNDELNRRRAILLKLNALIAEHNLHSKCRRREMVEMRQALMYWLDRHTKMTTTEVSGLFNKHHSTTIYSRKVVLDLISCNQLPIAAVEMLAEMSEFEDKDN